jgi:hypothetical protein
MFSKTDTSNNIELDHAFERQFIAAFYVACYIVMAYYTPRWSVQTTLLTRYSMEPKPKCLHDLIFHCQHEC